MLLLQLLQTACNRVARTVSLDVSSPICHQSSLSVMQTKSQLEGDGRCVGWMDDTSLGEAATGACESLTQDLNKQRETGWAAGSGCPDRTRPWEITHCHLQISLGSVSAIAHLHQPDWFEDILNVYLFRCHLISYYSLDLLWSLIFFHISNSNTRLFFLTHSWRYQSPPREDALAVSFRNFYVLHNFHQYGIKSLQADGAKQKRCFF